jgi:peptidoglycan-associated lipoprotein
MTMKHALWQVRRVVIPAVALGVALSGCAKTPSTSQSSAPAPTGFASADGSTARDSSSVVPATHVETGPGSGSGSASSFVGSGGAARPVPSEFSESATLGDIFFEFDKYNISAVAAQTLDENLRWLKSHPRYLVLIEGHADERGTNEYNLSLGERRAKSAANYFASHGVSATRVTIVSYGEERPQCSERTEPCWAKNRRARFLVKAQ